MSKLAVGRAVRRKNEFTERLSTVCSRSVEVERCVVAPSLPRDAPKARVCYVVKCIFGAFVNLMFFFKS